MKGLGQHALALRVIRQSAEASFKVLGISHPNSIYLDPTLKIWTVEFNEGKIVNREQSEQVLIGENGSADLHEDKVS